MTTGAEKEGDDVRTNIPGELQTYLVAVLAERVKTFLPYSILDS